MRRYFLMGYALLSLLNLFAIGSDHFTLQALSKSLLMPALIGSCLAVPWSNPSLRWTIITALLFSWMGDIALLFRANMVPAFLIGLGMFLVAHLFYIVGSVRTGVSFSSGPVSLGVTAVLIGGGIFLVHLLYPSLGSMQVPVMLYATVIIAMGIMAAMRAGHTSGTSYNLVLSGAVLFIISDSVIALNKFYAPFEGAGIFIMTTYLLAQYLLTSGFLLHQDNQTS